MRERNRCLSTTLTRRYLTTLQDFLYCLHYYLVPAGNSNRRNKIIPLVVKNWNTYLNSKNARDGIRESVTYLLQALTKRIRENVKNAFKNFIFVNFTFNLNHDMHREVTFSKKREVNFTRYVLFIKISRRINKVLAIHDY